MQQTMRTLGAVSMVELMAACAGGWVTPAFAQRARVPQTGQTQCFDASGNSVLCDGTGQDGELQGGCYGPPHAFRTTTMARSQIS